MKAERQAAGLPHVSPCDQTVASLDFDLILRFSASVNSLFAIIQIFPAAKCERFFPDLDPL